jgi:hypothetical protein
MRYKAVRSVQDYTMASVGGITGESCRSSLIMQRRERIERLIKVDFVASAAKTRKLIEYFRLDLFVQLLIENTADVSMPHE